MYTGCKKTGNRTLERPSTLNIYCMEIILQQLETRRLAFECHRFGKIWRKIEQIGIK